MKFRLDKSIGDLLVETVKAAGRKLGASAGRVQHRSRQGGPVGGRIVSVLRQGESLVRRERWGGVITWNELGQSFMFLVRGTKRQKARPVDLAPKEEAIRGAAEREASRHLQARDRRRGRR